MAMFRRLPLLACLFCLIPILFASDEIVLSEVTRFTQQDDQRFKAPAWDDRDWQQLSWQQVPPADFYGVSWLRCHFTVSPELQGQMVAFHNRRIIGAATFFLNGEEIFSIGQPGTSLAEEESALVRSPLVATLKEPWRVESNGDLTYILAIRHSNFFLAEAPWEGQIRPGVRFDIDPFQEAMDHYLEDLNENLINQWLILGICLSFSILHFLLFVFYPRERSNLFFALMTLMWAFLTYGGFNQPESFTGYLNTEIMVNVAMAGMIFFTVSMGHALMEVKRSPILYGFLVISVLYAMWGIFFPFSDIPRMWLLILMIAEMVRVMTHGHRRTEMKEGWIIGLGSVPISMMTLYNFSVSIFGFEWPMVDSIYYHYCIVVLLFSMSVFLAYRISLFQQSLERQIVQIQELSEENLKQELERVRLKTENDRKSLELETAREFQLSMLPKQMPDHPHVEMAATMSTATEVGGDYYDVFVSKDQTLTCVVGDATGHGIQAGTFVAGTKTLFNALAEEPKVQLLLQKMSRALKMMGLRKMFMALTFARYRDGELLLAAAGMPYALHYIAETGKVEEIQLKAPPLASLPSFPYQSVSLQLSPGDVICIFSDGLPERFNPQDEMFGEQRMVALLTEHGHEPPDTILQNMVSAGETWGEGRVQDDDITLVVLKRKRISV